MSSHRLLPPLIIGGILLVQLLTGLWHIRDPFIDGRYHYNWNPPFWLLNAQATNRVGIAQSFLGVATGFTDTPGTAPAATGFYESHPQLIGPIIALWTRIAGYGEWSPRLLSLLLIAAAAALFFFALRAVFGWRFAASSAAIFVSLPLIFIYGKMLNHEPLVLFFIAVSFLGFVKVIRGEARGMPVFVAGIIGMALSDWSGFVFGGLFILLLLSPPLGRSRAARRAALLALGALGLGLGLFFLQSFLQRSSLAGTAPDLSAFFSRYLDLWRYRSGQGAPIPWHLWALKELVFINRNYSLVLWIAGITGLGVAFARRRGEILSPEKRAVAEFSLAVAAGQLFYLVSLKQATFIHLYYQYFFSLPVAFGATLVLDRVAGFARSLRARHLLLLGSAAVVALASLLWSASVYTRLLTQEMWGDRSDIALIASLRDLPAGARVIAADNATALEWFANPNIIYYAGRPVERYTLAEVPFAPYQIVPAGMAQGLVRILAQGKAFGAPVPTDIMSCSTHFCLLHLHE